MLIVMPKGVREREIQALYPKQFALTQEIRALAPLRGRDLQRASI